MMRVMAAWDSVVGGRGNLLDLNVSTMLVDGDGRW